MEIGIILGWLISSIIIGAIGSTRKIGFFGAFALSLLLSPLIGLIISLVSKSKSDLEYQETLLNTLNQQKEISEKESNQKNISKITDELRKIKDLLDNEVINQDEFEKIKKRLVESIDSNNKTEDSSSILDSNKKYDPQKYFDGKLDIPKVISRNKNKIKFEDNEVTEVIKDIDEKYFFISKYGRQYYKSLDSAINASYIYKKTNKISTIDINE